MGFYSVAAACTPLSSRRFVAKALAHDVDLHRWDALFVEDVKRATDFVDEASITTKL
jgi:hypothetical protein